MAIYDFFLSRNNKATINSHVGHVGRLFYDDTDGIIKISDGSTPGGLNIAYSIASDTAVGGIKTGPGVTIDTNGVLFIDETGLDFSFGDFTSTVATYAVGHPDAGENYALLNSVNANEDVVIASNGTGRVDVIGEFNVRPTNGGVPGALLLTPRLAIGAEGVVTFSVAGNISQSGVQITTREDAISVVPSNTGSIMQLTGTTGIPARIYLDGVGNYPILIGRRYNLSGSTPTQAVNGDVLFRVAPNGAIVDGTFNEIGPGRIEWRATENHTSTTQGGSFSVYTVANGALGSSAQETLKLTSELLTLTGSILPDANSTRTLGSASLQWSNVHATSITTTGIISENAANDITLGESGDTGYVAIDNAGIQFPDTSVQTTAWTSTVPILSAVASTTPFIADSRVDPATISNMTLTPAAGTYLATFSSEYISTLIGSVTATASADLATLYAELQALSATVTGHAAAYGSGETLSAGVYTQAGASSIAGTLTLNGTATDLFVFRSAGALTTGAGAEIVLTGGAVSSNVWWVSQGAISTGVNTVIRGSLLSNQAANTPGNGTSIEGRLLAINGAIGISAADLTAPTGTISSSLTLGSLNTFSIFAAIGGLTNAGASTIALNIGTDNGTITGFGTATVSGETYVSGSPALSVIAYGIYVNGVLIADSNRTQTQISLVSGWPMSIHTIATVTAGQTVDVRATVPVGEFSIGPAMALTLVPVTN
jgi:hypothetical protein